MAEPIRLGLILQGEDAREFWENIDNPKVTKEQVEFFRDAIRAHKVHFLWYYVMSPCFSHDELKLILYTQQEDVVEHMIDTKKEKNIEIKIVEECI